MPDLSLLVVLLLAAAGVVVHRKLRGSHAPHCTTCRIEMVYDGALPDDAGAVLGRPGLPQAPDGMALWALFHCPVCGRRTRRPD